MEPTELQVIMCAYSRHTVPFRHHVREGLDYYIIRLQAEGISHAVVDGAELQVLPGDLLLFRPGQYYDLRVGEWGLSGDYYVLAKGNWLDRWFENKMRLNKVSVGLDGRLLAVWQQIILEKRRLDGGNPDLLGLLLQTLCLMADRSIRDASAHLSGSSFLGFRMKQYIEEHATSAFKLEDVAKNAGLSVSRAVHLFKSQFGQSIMKYSQQIRLALAMEYMRNTPLTLERIAEETGFCSYSYFHRVFSEQYGMPPGVYRRKLQK